MKKYQGATGNLALGENKKQVEIYKNLLKQEKKNLRETKAKLLR